MKEGLEAVEEMKASADPLTGLFEFSPISYFTLARDGTIQKVNPAGANLVGLERSPLPNQKFGQFLASHDLPMFAAFLDSVFTSKSKKICEATILRGNGEAVWARIEAVLCGSECLTAILDITDRKNVENKLQESEERFRHLLENIPNIAVQGYDSQRRVIFWNSASQLLYGYSREEALGQRLEDLIIPPPMRTAVIAGVEAWLKSGVAVPAGELVLLAKGGKPVHVFSSHCMQVNSRGESEMFCVDIDLTEQTRLQEQLRHSQKMEAIGELAGGVAHDLNNILTVILGYCDLLRMSSQDEPDLCADIDQVSASAGRAANLTRSLLTFSRKEGVRLQAHDLNDIVTSIKDFLSRIIGEDVKLEFSSGHEPLPVQADRGQVEQVLVNMATNARDAMPKGGVLSIATEVCTIEEPPGRYAKISVADSGQGMSEETLQRIFEPFFTTKGVGKGTGLGLSIVFGIVQQHQGFVTVHSQLGEGTTFCVHLPLREDRQEAAEQAIASSAPGQGTETILVVEDDVDVRVVMETILRRSGYKVIAAVNGEDGVARFAADPDQIALVLMDVIMPGINGQEAADRIWQIRPEGKVLFTSGYTADLLRSRADFADGYEVIPKPVLPAELLRTVRRILDR